jgi:rfaE bifunctional protein kinase chain/domain
VDSRYRLGEFKGIYGMTPNQEEAEALAGSRLDSESALLAAGKDLLARFELELLLITQGSRGMALFAKEGCSLIPVFGSAQVADVTGAGDTVIGTLSLALAAGASPLEAALLANLAGGLVVMKTGTATIGPEELRGAVTQAGQVLKEVRWVPS